MTRGVTPSSDVTDWLQIITNPGSTAATGVVAGVRHGAHDARSSFELRRAHGKAVVARSRLRVVPKTKGKTKGTTGKTQLEWWNRSGRP